MPLIVQNFEEVQEVVTFKQDGKSNSFNISPALLT